MHISSPGCPQETRFQQYSEIFLDTNIFQPSFYTSKYHSKAPTIAGTTFTPLHSHKLFTLYFNSLYLSIFPLFFLESKIPWPCCINNNHIYPWINRPPIFEPKNKFSYFWERIFLENLSFILELSFQYAMLTRKICA